MTSAQQHQAQKILSNKLRDFSLFNGIGETGYSG
jgi:hypothetical protein